MSQGTEFPTHNSPPAASQGSQITPRAFMRSRVASDTNPVSLSSPLQTTSVFSTCFSTALCQAGQTFWFTCLPVRIRQLGTQDLPVLQAACSCTSKPPSMSSTTRPPYDSVCQLPARCTSRQPSSPRPSAPSSPDAPLLSSQRSQPGHLHLLLAPIRSQSHLC